MKKPKIIRAYFMRVDEDSGVPYNGYFGMIDNTLEAMQRYVNFGRGGGRIQVMALKNGIDVVFHEEGKLLGFPPNRFWFGDEGRPGDFLVGNVLAVRHVGDEFASIHKTDDDYLERHFMPASPVRGSIIMFIPPHELLNYEEDFLDGDAD